MLKAVVFDLDGTVIDSTEAIVASSFHAFDAVGAPRPDRERIVDVIGLPLEAGLGELFGRDITDLVPIYREHYRAHACQKTHLLPHVETTLSALHAAGLKIGFATSKKREMSKMLLEHLGVLHYFSSHVGPDEVARPKPDPDAMYVSMAALGVSAEEMAFVGDMDFDVKAAHAAGVRSIAVATGYMSREQLAALGPEAVFDDLGPLAGYLLNGSA